MGATGCCGRGCGFSAPRVQPARTRSSAALAVARRRRTGDFLQAPFGDRVFDTVGELRTRLGARGVTAGLPDLAEVRTTLGSLRVPLHGSMPRSELLHLHCDVTEPAVDGHQPRRQVPLAVPQACFPDRGGAGGVRCEVRCPGKTSSTNFRIPGMIVVIVVCAVEPQHRPGELVDVWGLIARRHFRSRSFPSRQPAA